MHLGPHSNMLINTDIGAIMVKLNHNIIVIFKRMNTLPLILNDT